jgi:hypothetical protein
VRTPEDRAAADAELVDVEPEFDRRLMRCRCRHSIYAHPARFEEWGTNASTAPCQRCDCTRFQSRPAPWRVIYRPFTDGDVALLMLWPWLIESPRGARVYSLADRASALNLARSMAGLDELLARVQRLEHHSFGRHPALAASARRAPASMSDVDAFTAARPELTLVEGQEVSE